MALYLVRMYNYGWVERGYFLTPALQMIVPPIGMLSLHSEDLTRLLFNKYYNCIVSSKWYLHMYRMSGTFGRH